MAQWRKCLKDDDVRASFDRVRGYCLEKLPVNKIRTFLCSVKRQNLDMILLMWSKFPDCLGIKVFSRK